MATVSFKHFIGKTFYVPRVRVNYEKKTVVVDGLEYERLDTTYEPFVKKKIIDKIEINVSKKSTTVTYLLLNDNETPSDDWEANQLYAFIDESEINAYTEDEALEIAKAAAAEGRTVHGY